LELVLQESPAPSEPIAEHTLGMSIVRSSFTSSTVDPLLDFIRDTNLLSLDPAALQMLMAVTVSVGNIPALGPLDEMGVDFSEQSASG